MKNYKTLATLAATVGVLASSGTAGAATLAYYFDGNYTNGLKTAGVLVNSQLATNPDVTATDMSRQVFGGDAGGNAGSVRNSYGPAFVGTGNNYYLVYNGSNADTTLNDTSYLQFQVSADSGLTLDLSSITLDWAWAANAVGNWTSSLDVQTSTDGISFATVAGSFRSASTGDVVAGNTAYFTGGQGLEIDMSSLANAESYYIRIRSADDTTSNSHAPNLFQNITLNGEVAVIPEPSTALLGGLGMLALLRRRR